MHHNSVEFRDVFWKEGTLERTMETIRDVTLHW